MKKILYIQQSRNSVHMIPCVIVVLLAAIFGDISIEGQPVPYGHLGLIIMFAFTCLGFYFPLLVTRIPCTSNNAKGINAFLDSLFPKIQFIFSFILFCGRIIFPVCLEALSVIFLLQRAFNFYLEGKYIIFVLVPLFFLMHCLFEIGKKLYLYKKRIKRTDICI